MKNKVLKIGIVGLGRGLVANCLIKRKDVRISAICDRCDDKLMSGHKKVSEEIKRCGRKYTVKVYSDFDELLQSDVDALFIATDADNHVPLVIKAMEAGKHVICEIPAINSTEEAVALKECVKSHPNLKYMAAENCLYWAFIETWDQMYKDGMLGRAIYAEGAYIHARDRRKKNHGNVALAVCVRFPKKRKGRLRKKLQKV